MNKSNKPDPQEQLLAIRSGLARILGELNDVADTYSEQQQVDTGTYEIKHGGDVVALLYVELDPYYEPRDERFRIEHWGLFGPRDYRTGYIPPHTRHTSAEPNQPLNFYEYKQQFSSADFFKEELRKKQKEVKTLTYIEAKCTEKAL